MSVSDTPKFRPSLYDMYLKPFGLIATSVTSGVAMLYALGLAPLTAQTAHQMIAEYADKSSSEYERRYVAQSQLEPIKKAQEEQAHRLRELEKSVGDINTTVGRIDERSRNTVETNQQILNEIRKLK